MKISEVTDLDCKAVTDLLNGIRGCRVPQEFRLGDMAAVVDSLRWLQSFAVEMAKVRAAEANKPQVPLAEEKAMQEGFAIKEYHPGGGAVADITKPPKRKK